MSMSDALSQSYEDYLSDEPGAYGIPDGLSRIEYTAMQKEAQNASSNPQA